MDELPQALALAVRLLARRDHGTAELAQKLARRGVAPATAAAVIARLQEKGYLDDRRYAEQWARGATESGRGYGPRLRLELSRRGIAAEIVDEVVAAIGASHDERSVIAAVMGRRFSGFDPATATEKEKRRIVHYLQRRGFSVGEIFAFLREPRGEEG